MQHDQPPHKEIFHVAGDAPDPTGMSQARGVAPGYDLTGSAIGHPMLLHRLYGKEMVLEADVYKMDGEPMYIHLICPMCLANGRTSALRIVEGKKALSYEPREAVPPFPGWSREQMKETFPHGAGGLLSVEPFGCSWEESPELSRGFGLSVCNWKVRIDNNVVRHS